MARGRRNGIQRPGGWASALGALALVASLFALLPVSAAALPRALYVTEADHGA